MAAAAGNAAWRGSRPPPRALIAWRAHALAVADGYAVLKVHGGMPLIHTDRGRSGGEAPKWKNLVHSRVGCRCGPYTITGPAKHGKPASISEPIFSARSGSDNRQLSGVGASLQTLFVSYSKDSIDSLVLPLVSHLRTLRIPYWIDKDHIRFGGQIYDAIEEAIRCCDLCIAVISRKFLESVWPLHEMAQFENREHSEGSRIVLPVLKGVRPDEAYDALPFLQGRAFEKAESEADLSTVLSRVVDLLFWNNGYEISLSSLDEVGHALARRNDRTVLARLIEDGHYLSSDTRLSCSELCIIASLLMERLTRIGPKSDDAVIDAFCSRVRREVGLGRVPDISMQQACLRIVSGLSSRYLSALDVLKNG